MVATPVAALDNPVDLALLLLIAFLLFGKQLPEVARTLGKGIRELKESANFREMSEALASVEEIRSVATPGAIVRAALPGVAEIQDTAAAAKSLANPFELDPTQTADTPPASAETAAGEQSAAASPLPAAAGEQPAGEGTPA